MAEKWPSPIVARTEIKNFTGGVINSKYVANLDSQGLGPAGRFRIGRKVAYPISAVIEWLESRATSVEDRR
jgi:hypothetical protein